MGPSSSSSSSNSSNSSSRAGTGAGNDAAEKDVRADSEREGGLQVEEEGDHGDCDRENELVDSHSAVAAARARSKLPDGCPYLRLWAYEKTPAAALLSGDFDIPECFADSFDKLPAKARPASLPRWLMVGAAGVRTPLHIDPWLLHAWFAAISGRKRFILYTPESLRHVCDGTGFLNPRNPDTERFPDSSKAHSIECVLHPGEMMFLPAHWPHDVESLDHCTSLTHNFVSARNFKKLRLAFMMKLLKNTLASSSSSSSAASEEAVEDRVPGEQEEQGALDEIGSNLDAAAAIQ